MTNRKKDKLKIMIMTTMVVFFVIYMIGFILLYDTMHDLQNVIFFSFSLLIFAGIICIYLGSVFISRIVSNDKRFIYSSLGESNTNEEFIEFANLFSDYNTKLENLFTLKTSVTNATKHLNATKIKVNISQKTLNSCIDQKNKVETMYNYTDLFYKDISKRLSSMIWITDYYGNVLYCNSHLIEKLKLDIKEKVSIFEILKIDQNQFDLFRKKDFAKITLDVKNISPVPGRSIRIFDQQSIKAIIFMSDMSNQDKIMTRTYLKKSRDLHFINEVSKIISGQVSIESTLQDAIDKITFLGNFNACGIRLINDENELVLKAKSGYSHSTYFPDKVNSAGTHIGYAFKESKIITINAMNDMLFDEHDVTELINMGKKLTYIPLTNYNKNLGVMTIIADDEIDSESVVLFESISITVTIALEKILLYEKLKSNYFKTVEAFVTASELKSENFSGHSRRVAEISKKIAERLFLSAYEIDEIYITGLLHDVGKLISSESEMERKKSIKDEHGLIGRIIIEKVGFNKDVLDGIEYHHLNYDLSNAEGVEVNEQPYYAQIIRLVSDFDVMMFQRTDSLFDGSVIEALSNEVGRAYSPQFTKILENFVLNESVWLEALYSTEVTNA